MISPTRQVGQSKETKVLRIFSLLFFAASLHATTFKVQPIEQQIRESDGIFQGHYLKRKTVKLENGSLATQMIFKMSKEVGLQSDFFGMDEVIVHYPGGELNGEIVKVEGVPHFVSGEKVILFIHSVENRYWGLNLGFGTFKVINYGKEVMMVNTIFPEHPQVGQLNIQDFEKKVKDIKGSNLKVVQSIHYPTLPTQNVVQRFPASVRQNRSLASKSEQSDNEGNQPNLQIFWLVIVLGFSGGLFRLGRSKASR